jgi:hypothetical protein
MTDLLRSCYEASVLPDGRYDAFIVDVNVEDDVATLELTILAGEHKGAVVSVSARGLGRGETDLIGMPATLVVEDGVPRVTVDD